MTCLGTTANVVFSRNARVAAPPIASTRDAEGRSSAATWGQEACARLHRRRPCGEHGRRFSTCLKERNIRAGFFVTGNFARMRPICRRSSIASSSEGHYLGPHSDSHPLYCDWKDRQKTLVTRAFFTDGPGKESRCPAQSRARCRPACRCSSSRPTNGTTASKSRGAGEMGVELINFTPGSGSNRDYAPEGDPASCRRRKSTTTSWPTSRKTRTASTAFSCCCTWAPAARTRFTRGLGPLCDELARRGYHSPARCAASEELEPIFQLLCGQRCQAGRFDGFPVPRGDRI